MIWDCFTFFNETLLLEARLNELDGVVDRFVVVESPVTFQGVEKPLVFEENAARYAQWADRIVHVVAPPLPGATSAWDREYHQRHTLLLALEKADDDDVVIVSDVDEIPRASLLEQLALVLDDTTALAMSVYYYKVNLRHSRPWHHPKVTRVGALKGSAPNELRVSVAPNVAADAGWHFSYLGGEDELAVKLNAFSHAEEVTGQGYGSAAHLRRCTDLGVDFGFGTVLEVAPDSELPAWIRDQRSQRPGLFSPGRSLAMDLAAHAYGVATRRRKRIGGQRLDRHPVLGSAYGLALAVGDRARSIARRPRGPSGLVVAPAPWRQTSNESRTQE